MTAQSMPKRAAWEDRFREPTPEELLRSIVSTPAGEMTREFRKRLLSFDHVSEKVEWQGVPWRWSLVYTCTMDPTRAFAYIIPDPAKAQVSIPLTVPMVQTLPLKRMKKAVRDGILFSRFVAGVHWPSWQLDAVAQLDELVEIVQRKYRGVVGEWGGAGGGPSGGTEGGRGGAGGGESGGSAGGGGGGKPGSKKQDNAR